MVQITGTMYAGDGSKIKNGTGVAVLDGPIVVSAITYNPRSINFSVVDGVVTDLTLETNTGSNRPASFYSILFKVGSENTSFKLRVGAGAIQDISTIVVFDLDYAEYNYVLEEDPVYLTLLRDLDTNDIPDIFELGKQQVEDTPRASLGGVSGTLNGVATAFFTGRKYIAGTLRAYVNGLLYVAGQGLTETSPAAGSFAFTTPIPGATDIVKLIYSYVA